MTIAHGDTVSDDSWWAHDLWCITAMVLAVCMIARLFKFGNMIVLVDSRVSVHSPLPFAGNASILAAISAGETQGGVNAYTLGWYLRWRR